MRQFLRNFIVLPAVVLLAVNTAHALPDEPPPPGKVWVKDNGQWIVVAAPPGDGPYLWKSQMWELDETPPPHDSQWIPGNWVSAHWKGKKWIPAHWVQGHWGKVVSPGNGARWVPGHWKGNKWIPGHWGGALPAGKSWVPGHYDPYGRWVPGHWQ